MSLWKRILKRKSNGDELTDPFLLQRRLEAVEIVMSGEGIRDSPAVGEMLGYLWETDTTQVCHLHPQAVKFFTTLADRSGQMFGIDALSPLQERLAQAPAPPERPEERYAAFAQALREAIAPRVGIVFSHNYSAMTLLDLLKIVRWFQVVEAQDVLCDNLQKLHASVNSHQFHDELNYASLQPIQDALESTLLALPPDSIPDFWAALTGRVTEAADFWPIAGRMRDRRAVPYLLQTLTPKAPLDCQSAVIHALGQIADARALLVLQPYAADKTNLLAPIAQRAIDRIMRASRDDAAQLLRPSSAIQVGNPRETLLRPAAGVPEDTTPPDQLLRPTAQEEPANAPASNEERLS